MRVVYLDFVRDATFFLENLNFHCVCSVFLDKDFGAGICMSLGLSLFFFLRVCVFICGDTFICRNLGQDNFRLTTHAFCFSCQ